MMLHTYNAPPMSLLSINYLQLTVSEIWPGQDFIGQGHYSKVKSRSDHDVAHLHPLTNAPTKYLLPTPYGFRDIARTRFYRSRSNQGQTMTLHTYVPNQCLYQVLNSHTLRFPRYSPDKILYVKVKSRSDHDVAHLHPLTNVATKYELPTPYGF